jgi:hypothetical protein
VVALELSSHFNNAHICACALVVALSLCVAPGTKLTASEHHVQRSVGHSHWEGRRLTPAPPHPRLALVPVLASSAEAIRGSDGVGV